VTPFGWRANCRSAAGEHNPNAAWRCKCEQTPHICKDAFSEIPKSFDQPIFAHWSGAGFEAYEGCVSEATGSCTTAGIAATLCCSCHHTHYVSTRTPTTNTCAPTATKDASLPLPPSSPLFQQSVVHRCTAQVLVWFIAIEFGSSAYFVCLFERK
jgi:hypothetical protein